MSRAATLRLLRAALAAAGIAAVAIISFGLWVISADIQSEEETLEEKS